LSYENIHTNCPACEAPADNVNTLTAMAVCIYCGAGFYLDDGNTISLGPLAITDDDASPLYTGASGTLEDRRFSITGRLRYDISGGHEDLWCLLFEDSLEFGCLIESEGEFNLKEETASGEVIPAFDNLRPEARFEIAGSIVTVDEKNKAILEGAEGSLSVKIKKGIAIPFVKASFDDYAVTIEYGSGGPKVYVRRHMDLSDINLDILKADLEFDD